MHTDRVDTVQLDGGQVVAILLVVVCCLGWGIWVGGQRSVCSERVALHGHYTLKKVNS